MRKVLIMTLCGAFGFLFSLNLYAKQVRVYCQPHDVVTEYSLSDDVIFTEDNKLYPVNTIIMEESEIPPHKYREQLRCENDKLVVDEDYKPAWAVRIEMKTAQIKQAQAALDEELGKADPDIITVVRLQRAIEKLKKGESLGGNEALLPELGP